MTGYRADDVSTNGSGNGVRSVPGLPPEALLLLDRVIELTAEHLIEPARSHLLSGPRPTRDKPPVLGQLVAIERIQVELEAQIISEARRALREGLSYTNVGWALGISKQRAHQRFRS